MGNNKSLTTNNIVRKNDVAIRYVSIDEIFPYENNPRKNDDAIEKVMESLDRYGFQQPIVVDKDFVIIVGHTRYKAAIELGYEEVPILIADDLTDEQVKTYRLADNKVGEFSKWNDKMLAQEIQSLLDENSLILSFFDGFNLGNENKSETCTCPKCKHMADIKEFENA